MRRILITIAFLATAIGTFLAATASPASAGEGLCITAGPPGDPDAIMQCIFPNP